MFGKKIKLFTLLGFNVYADMSWLILALLITWSLGAGLFPEQNPGFAPLTYWWMGAAGALGMFLSIVFHELCHSLVARRYGMPMNGITLFIFGGVAEMDDEPPSPKAEFWMAIVGPLSSIALGFLFLGAAYVIDTAAAAVAAVLGYLAVINWVLAGFNLLPAFPLDGGRVLRSIIWKTKNDLRKATYIASQLGSGFGIFIIFLGVVNVVRGNFIGGLWQFMIGMFLRSAAEMSYKQVLIRRALGGTTVSQIMTRDPVAVSPDLSLQDLIENYVFTRHFKLYPIIDQGRIAGCITVDRIKEIPREEWAVRTVGEAAVGCSADNALGPDADVLKALSQMNKSGTGRLMVTEDGKLLGIVSRKDIMDYLSIKMDLQK